MAAIVCLNLFKFTVVNRFLEIFCKIQPVCHKIATICRVAIIYFFFMPLPGLHTFQLLKSSYTGASFSFSFYHSIIILRYNV